MFGTPPFHGKECSQPERFRINEVTPGMKILCSHDVFTFLPFHVEVCGTTSWDLPDTLNFRHFSL